MNSNGKGWVAIGWRGAGWDAQYSRKPYGMHAWMGWDDDGMRWERTAMGSHGMKSDAMGWDGIGSDGWIDGGKELG